MCISSLLRPGKLTQAVMLLAHIWEVPNLYLSQDSNGGIFVVFSVCPGAYIDNILSCAMAASFNIVPSYLSSS
jgi:hypothetical protein